MATKNEKMTNVKALAFVLDNYGAELPTEVAEKLTGMMNKAKAKSETKVATADKPENVELRNKIVEFLSDGEAHTCGEIGTAIGVTTSKAVALLNTLQDKGMVVRDRVKGKPVFTLAGESAEVETE